jgi:hypothetical protein
MQLGIEAAEAAPFDTLIARESLRHCAKHYIDPQPAPPA